MKILVTGGAGYVGSICVRELCNSGHEVFVYDNLSRGHHQAVDSRAILMVADLGNGVALRRAFKENSFDAVMHFAAFAEVGESVRDPLLYFRNNIANSINLMEAMRDHGARRMIFSSSCAVYGTPPRVPITEDMPYEPISPYGRTKLAMEWLMQDCARAWGLAGTALRYFNAAGAASDGSLGEDHDPESHLIPRVLFVALGKADNIAVFGTDYPTPDGTCIRDYVHAEDLAVAHRLALERTTPGTFRAYNLGTGRGTSVTQIIEAARAVTGHPIPITTSPRRSGDPPELYADPSKAFAELNWRPKHIDAREIVETAWNWHQKKHR